MALSKIKAPSIADDSITVDQIADNAVHGRRNLIINGAMNVAQRGTSKTGITSSIYSTVDRIAHNHDYPTGVTSIATSQDSDGPSGFTKCFKIEPEQARTAALSGADRLFVTYKLEAQNLTHLDYGSSDAKNLTVSFWVKSNLTGIVTVEITSPDSGSSYQYYHETITINTADTWEYKTFQILGNTNGTINNDTGIGLQMGLHVASGPTFTSGTFSTGSWRDGTSGNRSSSSNIDIYSSASNYFKITGIQFEVGDKATPFEHRSYGDELLECQRYYREYGGNTANERVGVGFNHATNQCRLAIPLSPNMRTAPSESTSADSHWTVESHGQYACSSIGLDQASPKVASFNCTTSSSSLLHKGAGQLMGNTSSARLKLSAEL